VRAIHHDLQAIETKPAWECCFDEFDVAAAGVIQALRPA